jgi:hypothetical protein
MLLAVDMGTILGGAGTLIASVVGFLAYMGNRKNAQKQAAIDAKKADTSETQQAFDLQDRAMQDLIASNKRLTNEVGRVRDKNDEQHDTINRILGQLGETKAREQQCQRDLNALGDRLRLAEARIAELGG